MAAKDKVKKTIGSLATMYAPWTTLGKETKAEQKAAQMNRANKKKEAKASAEGKTYDELKEEVNDPYLKTQKTGMSVSAASTPDMNDATDHSIQPDTPLTSVRNANGDIATSRDEAAIETPESVQEKLDSPSETNDVTVTEEAPVEQDNSDIENKPEAEEEKKQRYQMKSIWDAYRDGDIDANTRDYLMIDAISNSVHNFAQDQGKIAAAYGGGNFNANYKDSAWDQRNKEMMKQGISSEAATVEGSDKEMERQLQRIQANAGKLSNEQKEYMLGASRTLKDLSNAAKTNTEKALLNALASDVADGNIDGKGLVAIAAASGIGDLKKLIFGDETK